MENKKTIAYKIGQTIGTIFCGFVLAIVLMSVIIILQEIAKGVLYIITEWKIQFSASALIVLAGFLIYGMTKVK